MNRITIESKKADYILHVAEAKMASHGKLMIFSMMGLCIGSNKRGGMFSKQAGG